MKNRDDKKKDFEALRKDLEAANNVFVTGFEKMTVDQDFNLRKTVRGVGGNVQSGQEQHRGNGLRRHVRRGSSQRV